MSENHLTITVDSVIADPQSIASQADDAAFEHAMSLAQSGGWQIGDEKFAAAYLELKHGYDDALDYLYYVNHVSLLAVKAMLETGLAHLTVDVGADAEKDVSQSLQTLALAVAAAISHVIASGEEGWITNDEMERLPVDKRSIPFKFARMRITVPTDGGDE